MMQSKWWTPAGAASSALLLALCMQRISAFQPSSPLAFPLLSRGNLLASPSSWSTSPNTHPSILSDKVLFANTNNNDDDDSKEEEASDKKDTTDEVKRIILDPYLPALDPTYSARGPIGENTFLISRLGPPTADELTNDQMLKIVRSETTDLEVNTLVWKCLGYRFDPEKESWSPDEVFPKWKERFPDPPDFIGMRRVYSQDVDGPSLRSNQALVRSIPSEYKQSLKPTLKPLGFNGFKLNQLTPNITRRAQCANWLIFYREQLFGYTLEELKERRRLKKEAEVAAEKKREEEGEEEGNVFKSPVKEVF